jgi:hypothetical protein
MGDCPKTLKEQFDEFIIEFDAQRAKRGLGKILPTGRRLPRPSIKVKDLSPEELEAKLEEYRSKLHGFDRHYERSDDPSVYRSGKRAFDELMSLRALVDKDFAIWDEFFEGKNRF